MKISILIIGILCCHQILIAQKIDVESQRYIGEKDSEYEFFQYKQRTGLIKPHLIKYKLYSDLSFNEKLHKPWYLEEVKILTSDEVEVFYNYRENKLKLKIDERDSTYIRGCLELTN